MQRSSVTVIDTLIILITKHKKNTARRGSQIILKGAQAATTEPISDHKLRIFVSLILYVDLTHEIKHENPDKVLLSTGENQQHLCLDDYLSSTGFPIIIKTIRSGLAWKLLARQMSNANDNPFSPFRRVQIYF